MKEIAPLNCIDVSAVPRSVKIELCTMAIRGAMQRKKPPEATGGHESGQSPRKENKWQK